VGIWGNTAPACLHLVIDELEDVFDEGNPLFLSLHRYEGKVTHDGGDIDGLQKRGT
jgi:hypothetical protein